MIQTSKKPMKITSLAIIAGMFAFAGTSEAEEGKKPKKEISQELLAKYDSDKNGVLNSEELAAMEEELAAIAKAEAVGSATRKAHKKPKASKAHKKPQARKTHKKPQVDKKPEAKKKPQADKTNKKTEADKKPQADKANKKPNVAK